MQSLALAMIVKGDDKEAEALDRCLKNVSQHVGGVFVTITHKKGETPNRKTIDVAKEYGAVISHYEWTYDFAAARNFNFGQVPESYEYILWCDADDMFRGLEDLESAIKEHPADAYVLNYLYAFDEHREPVVVHMKTQIVRNDGCVEWQGELHEDFRQNREISTYFIKGIERMHMSNDERFGAAKERNVEVAMKQMLKRPDDPRSYWNLGNSLKAVGKDSEALEAFAKFMGMSESDDEKYVVRLRMAECRIGMGDLEGAIDECRYAIGTKYRYPDAFILLGHIYSEQGRFVEAQESYLHALELPKPYHSIIVYNPRDYDYTPMMGLAKAYYNMGRPDLTLPLLDACCTIYPKNTQINNWLKALRPEVEKFNRILELVKSLESLNDEDLRKELEKVPQDFQSHPAICKIRNTRFIKQESSGRDLVIYCGTTAEEWTPETAKTKGIGGSEEAVIWISKLLAQKGWNVTVYNACGHKEQQFDGVTYRPFWTWNPRDRQDVVVLWRHNLRLLDYPINAKKIYVDLHDVTNEKEFTKSRLAKVAGIFVKSKVHRDLMPSIPDGKFIIVPNGIDVGEFSKDEEKDPYLMINTSSPDRSLSALVELFPRVKERVPQAKMAWAYGWNVFDAAHKGDPKHMAWKDDIVKGMEDAGIENLGRLGHGEIARLYRKARVFAYPSEFLEIDCISLSKAMAAGAVPVTTDFAAMGEKANHGGFFVHSPKTSQDWCQDNQFDFALSDEQAKQEWVDRAVQALTAHPGDDPGMRAWAKRTFDWNSVADRWDCELGKSVV